MITLDSRECGDQFLVAYHEADAPAGHVVALAHGEKFHGYVACTRDLHDRRGLPAVKANVGIRQIVHHQDSVLLCQRHHSLEKIEFHALRSRIAGKAQDHHLRFRNRFTNCTLQFLDEVHAGRHADRTDVGTGDDGSIDMDRIAGVGHQNSIAVVQRGEHQVSEALFGADSYDGFAIRIE